MGSSPDADPTDELEVVRGPPWRMREIHCAVKIFIAKPTRVAAGTRQNGPPRWIRGGDTSPVESDRIVLAGPLGPQRP